MLDQVIPTQGRHGNMRVVMIGVVSGITVGRQGKRKGDEERKTLETDVETERSDRAIE